jgi:hypothetical protein
MSEEADGTLKAYIIGQMQEKRAASIERLPIPRFTGRLVLRCRTPSDRDRLAYGYRVERAAEGENAIPALVEGAVKLLLDTCDGVETDREEDLGVKLGIGLATYLGPEVCGVPHDDTEAVLGIFGGEVDVVEAAGELQNRSGATNIAIEREIAGNSEAAG